MDESPSVVGARAEREVAYALGRAGWDVYLPAFAPHARIDLIATRGPDLVRVQCKTSRLRTGVVVFRTCSNTGNVPKRYDGEVDVFGVYSPELERVYLVPPAELPGSEWCSLRVDPPANNQTRGIRFAAEYELRPPR